MTAATGVVRVEKVRGRSALTRCFARYPLKLIAPSKVGPASCDAVWLYALTYGGGIVSVSPSPLPLPPAPLHLRSCLRAGFL
jgi:urease accessory protein UreH